MGSMEVDQLKQGFVNYYIDLLSDHCRIFNLILLDLYAPLN